MSRCSLLRYLKTRPCSVVGLVLTLFLLHYILVMYITNTNVNSWLKRQHPSSIKPVFRAPVSLPSPPKYAIPTLPQAFPMNGTGISINIYKDFNINVINSFCKTAYELKSIVTVYSSPGDFIKRSILRNSFGKWATSLNSRLMFIVGIHPKQHIHDRMKSEYTINKDLLIINKMDSYRGLNNKAYGMVRFIDQYCKNAPYVIHLVDDTFVHLEKFLERLQSIQAPSYFLGGLENKKTVRDNATRTHVTPEEYPYERFPIYAFGCAYAFPTNISKLMLQAAVRAPYIWIEDVWFTGHVRQTAGIGIVPLRRGELTHNATKAEEAARQNRVPDEFFVIHQVPLPYLEHIYITAYKRRSGST